MRNSIGKHIKDLKDEIVNAPPVMRFMLLAELRKLREIQQELLLEDEKK